MENTRLRIIQGEHGPITYFLTRKQVKNVNLRIRRNGEVHVSASRRVPVAFIDEWILSKEAFIRQALSRYEKEVKREGGSSDADQARRGTSPEDKARALAFLEPICWETWQLLQSQGVQQPAEYPTIRVRTMKSRWGSCIPAKNVITLNTRLLTKSRRAAEYVVLHEFAHFTHMDHSVRFYRFVEELMPDWRERKKELQE